MTSNTELVNKLSEAAKSSYNINEFDEVTKYVEDDDSTEDGDLEKKYLKRGELGELILHLMLRNFHNTIPLISKIYFKDENGSKIHGFDGVLI